ncbi:hypothetical protein ACLJJ6_05450 [Pediococcus siamensis]|uniref:hypothetical protein n=1 Tax=Pediococcus siamensis TaxID=381829 RepID=UPI0039A34508
MENLQQKHQFTNLVQNSYRKFFADSALEGIEPQMPTFQLQQFLAQATQRNYPVTIQINGSNAIYESSGHLTVLTKNRYVLTSPHQNVTHLLKLQDIRFIKKMN